MRQGGTEPSTNHGGVFFGGGTIRDFVKRAWNPFSGCSEIVLGGISIIDSRTRFQPFSLCPVSCSLRHVCVFALLEPKFSRSSGNVNRAIGANGSGLLGEGSYSAVWLMKDLKQNGALVAVKCLKRSNVRFPLIHVFSFSHLIASKKKRTRRCKKPSNCTR